MIIEDGELILVELSDLTYVKNEHGDEYHLILTDQSIKTICYDCFKKLIRENITKIQINEGCINIFEYFSRIRSLKEVIFSDSVECIGDQAFEGCTNLINLVNFGKNIQKIGSYAFKETTNLCIDILLSKTISLIGSGAFYCSGITSFNIEDGAPILEIKDHTFYYTKNLINVFLSKNIEIIDREAFSTSNIRNIYFENDSNLKTICDNCFYNSILETINLPSKLIKIGRSAFYMTKISSIVIPNSVTTIGEYAFFKCSFLQNVKIPNSIDKIRMFCFTSTIINKIKIPKSLISIETMAFEDCTHLTEVSFDFDNIIDEITCKTNLINIEEGAFSGCTSLIKCDILYNVHNVGYKCFTSTNLKDVTFSNKLISLGRDCFSYCNNLTSVKFESPIDGHEIYIGEGCFSNCRVLQYVELPNTLKVVNDYLFYLSGLKSINIPKSVTSIKEYAFSLCLNLEKVNFEKVANNITINKYAFQGCLNLENINISSKTFRKCAISAFINCFKLKSKYGIYTVNYLYKKVIITNLFDIYYLTNYLTKFGNNIASFRINNLNIFKSEINNIPISFDPFKASIRNNKIKQILKLSDDYKINELSYVNINELSSCVPNINIDTNKFIKIEDTVLEEILNEV